MKDLHVKILALVLILVGVALCYYKATRLGFPLRPTEDTEVWTVEARIKFQAHPGPNKVQFFIPRKPPGFFILNEDFVSRNYGLATEDDGVNRQALWAVRRAQGKQVLYYRIELDEDPNPASMRVASGPEYRQAPDYPEPDRSAILALLDNVRSESADIASFARELLIRLNDPDPDENVSLLRKDTKDPAKWVRKIIYVLAGAHISAHMVHVLELKDALRHSTLTPWLEVHDGREWLAFNPKTGQRGFPPDSLVWFVGEDPLVSVRGGRAAEVEYSVARNLRPLISVAEQRAHQADSGVMQFSFFGLPLQTQNVYRILVLVPIGAFLVVIFRNFVGIKTFGTFMPILIALAFRETQLLWGIVLFSLMVALGLMVRFYLEKLKLLLVPRLASVLIIVILMMAGISILSHKLGLEHGLSVALFPMVIMAMTIERMSQIWEELGSGEALKQGLGSLLVASVSYLAMSSKLLGHLAFVFPELLLVFLALTLLMGRYTGYRLSELWRFRMALKYRGTL